MKTTQLRSIGTLSLREALRTDSGTSTGAALAAVFAAHGHDLHVRAHHWPAEDDVDAELRRAVAYRHGCLVVDDEYLLGPEGAIDLARCEQSYSFFRVTIASCVAASPKRLTKGERAHMTRVAARFIASAARTMFGGGAQVEAAAKALSGMGATVSLPSCDLRETRGEKEAAVSAALLLALGPAIQQADAVVPAVTVVKPAVRQVPYLRLVR